MSRCSVCKLESGYGPFGFCLVLGLIMVGLALSSKTKSYAGFCALPESGFLLHPLLDDVGKKGVRGVRCLADAVLVAQFENFYLGLVFVGFCLASDFAVVGLELGFKSKVWA